MAEATKSKKWYKWAIAAVVVVVAIILIWYFTSSVSGNKYASADSIKKAKSGQYGKWGDSNSTNESNWYQFLAKSKSLFGLGGTGYGDPNGGDNQAYASAWLRGMDISRNESNLETFQVDIKKYINSSFKKPDWEVTTGSFLNSTAV